MYIFISSRYGDNQNLSDRMADHVRLRYGIKNVIRDLAQNADAVRRSKVILAVIGPQWLTDANLTGERLLDNPNDPVHAVLAQALRDGKFIVPLLIDGATMPAADVLPPDLAPLVSKQAFAVRGDPYFHADMLRAFAQINTQLSWRPASWGILAGMLAFIASFIAIIALAIVNNGKIPTAGLLNGLLILSFFLALAVFLATVAWAIRLTVRRQGWLWLAAILTAIALMFGIPTILAVAGISSALLGFSVLIGGCLIIASLFGVALFGPRKETTRAVL